MRRNPGAWQGKTLAPSKANWAKAALLWMLIFFAIGILMSLIGGLGSIAM